MSFKACLTYKLSQDHLELFFSAVRAAGGFNNPTAQQFMAAYKRLLLRSTIKGGQHYHSWYCWWFLQNIKWQSSYHIWSRTNSKVWSSKTPSSPHRSWLLWCPQHCCAMLPTWQKKKSSAVNVQVQWKL